MKDRMPAVAGTFYPATSTSLKNQVINLFEKVTKVPESDVAALIVPHAGYVFSGGVAASAYAKLNRNARYKNIFIIGRSHRKYFAGVSIYPKGHYTTPSERLKSTMKQPPNSLKSTSSFITMKMQIVQNILLRYNSPSCSIGYTMIFK